MQKHTWPGMCGLFTPAAMRIVNTATLDLVVKTVLSLGGPKIALTLFEMLYKEGSPRKGFFAALFTTLVCIHFLSHAYGYLRGVYGKPAPTEKKTKDVNDFVFSYMAVFCAIAFAKALTWLAKGIDTVALIPTINGPSDVNLGMHYLTLGVGLAVAMVLFLMNTYGNWVITLTLMMVVRIMMIMPSVLVQEGRYDHAVVTVVLGVLLLLLKGGMQEALNIPGNLFDEITHNGAYIRKTPHQRVMMGLGFWSSGIICVVINNLVYGKSILLEHETSYKFPLIFLATYGICAVWVAAKEKGNWWPTFVFIVGVFITSQTSSILSYCLAKKWQLASPKLMLDGLTMLAIYGFIFLFLTLSGLKIKRRRHGLGFHFYFTV